MAHLITWSVRASDDLDSIAAYIATNSEVYAAAVVRTILKKTRSLSDSPRMGRIVPEFNDPDIREIFAYSYRVIYRVNAEEVIVAAIIHGSRLIDISLAP